LGEQPLRGGRDRVAGLALLQLTEPGDTGHSSRCYSQWQFIVTIKATRGVAMTDSPTYPDLDGKVAVPTGSSQGIGAAAATALPDWQAALDTNLTAPFLALKTFLPGMIERGHGSIVTLASAAARLASGDRIGAPTAYAAAKAGLVRLTQEAAKEAGPHGVRVNCVAPSTILTERLESV